MLIKMGKAPKEVLKSGVTIYQAAARIQITMPALLGMLSTSKVPMRAWHAYDRNSLVFTRTDIIAFAKIERGFFLAPEEIEGAKKWLDYVAQTTTLVPEFHEVYGDEPGAVDCTFSYSDAVFWASIPSSGILESMLKGSSLSEEDQKEMLTHIRALGRVAQEFYLTENLSAFDAPCTSLLDMAERRAGDVYLADPQGDYLASQLSALKSKCPMLTAIVIGDTATLRSFIYETLKMGKPSEYRLAQQIIEEELPSIPRYQVSRLWDGDYGFSNPLWIYIKAVENMAELVMRFI